MEIRYTDLTLKIDPERKMPGHKVYEYPDILPEILYMTNYDSYWKNDPGYAIAFPATGETKEEFVPDKWYMFLRQLRLRSPPVRQLNKKAPAFAGAFLFMSRGPK